MSANTVPLPFSCTLRSEEETAKLAQRLAPALGAGDVLLLQGPIGAGKTHFARSLIQFLMARDGHVEDVPSPTFTLVQTYDAGALEIWHSDLYRLTHPDEVTELGLEDAFETALCLIEWPDRLGELVPETALTLTFSQGDTDDARQLTLSATDPRWADRLTPLLAEASYD
ncbi:tRNA (adenosine(37)-N6)-threonylcarbamoyltransferase complex ATPase subunit type 1 TsaE [Actibacterium lipolyticum]|uniref:tRNA threonylcarbamoyladenosine biosynthesis protein TsaE n=1 Tax=Actibacterium lipolyticum TaxID=1524263 RepID=A0A238KX06_9RHOB|nr:tRNA (adenosine(37)-N6)-threonylcarbamoyltransferase complex ATPase subunit type 1 TsaE [Actibacterium lipolyticum]SMX47160.1 tRNA threonylcarbamoyladenosine biosynthesis protein TsaE [Actibacterium lipolyticum]